MLSRIHREEQGVALITAMLVGMVALSLSLVTIQLSAHNSGASAYDRKRVQAVHAAEAGLDTYLTSLPTTPTASLQCTPPVTSLPVAQGAQFQVTAAFYPTFPGVAGQEMACPLSASNPPASAVITSRGTAVAVGNSRAVSRTMQTEVRLTAQLGLFTHAIFSNSGFTVLNNLQVNGNNGNDGNLYTNGNFTCNNSSLDYGSVIAHGTVTLGDTCRIAQDVWTSGDVTMRNFSRVGHDLTTSGGSITMENLSMVVNNARAAGACTGCGGRVGGTITTTSPSPEPPTIGFPTVNFDQAAWQAMGYTIRNETACPSALSFIRGLNASSIPYVVRISTPCALALGPTDTIRLGANLAIVTNGSVSMSQQTRVESSSTTIREFFVIVPRSLFSPATPPDSAATNCSGQDITLANQTSFSNVESFLYTPCTVTIANNTTGLQGQILGGTVDIQNHFTMTFRPMLIPGFGSITGYSPDIAYIREITN